MPISLRKNSPRGTVGLDIDERFLAAAQVSDGRIERAASTELPEGIVRGGEVADPEALAAALKEFTVTAGLPKSVRLGVSNQQVVVRLLELPVIEDQKEREAAVRFEAADAIAMPLDEAILDHQIAGAGGSEGGTLRMRIVVVAARRTMIDGFVAEPRAPASSWRASTSTPSRSCACSPRAPPPVTRRGSSVTSVASRTWRCPPALQHFGERHGTLRARGRDSALGRLTTSHTRAPSRPTRAPTETASGTARTTRTTTTCRTSWS